MSNNNNPRPERYLAVALTVLVLVAAGPSRADAITDIRARGVVLVAVSDDNPPYSFRDRNGQRLGLEPDLAADIAATLGVGLRLVPVDLTGRIEALLSNRADVLLAGLVRNRRIERAVHAVSPPYYASGSAVLARKSEKFRRWADLAGVSVCSIEGAPHNEKLAGDYGAEVIGFKAVGDAFDALEAGACRAFAYTDSVLLRELRSDPRWQDFELPLPAGDESPWVIATRPGEPLLSAALSGIVLRWHRSGLLSTLEDKWKIPRTPFVETAQGIYR